MSKTVRENTLRTIWKNGGAAVNGWLHIPSSWAAEVMANQGWDSLTIDMQHGMVDFGAALQMLQAISTTNTIPMVRVNWNEPGIIMKMLDAGSFGIICPMINNRAEAESFVQACRYAPEGIRSVGPSRAVVYAGNDYADHANREVIAMGMVETGEALNNLEEILSTKGLDAIYVGPADLSLSLRGKGTVDNDDAEFLAILNRIVTACKTHGIVAGIHTNTPEYAAKMQAMGYQFTTIGTDTRLLGAMCKQVLSVVRQQAPASKSSSVY